MSLLETDPDVVDYLLRRKATQWVTHTQHVILCLFLCVCVFFLSTFLFSTGVLTCCRQRSPSPWASAIPLATPTRYPVASCPLMTTTPQSWVSGEENQGAQAASSSSVSQSSTVWWGRWLGGAESLELTPGELKVSFTMLLTVSDRYLDFTFRHRLFLCSVFIVRTSVSLIFGIWFSACLNFKAFLALCCVCKQ